MNSDNDTDTTRGNDNSSDIGSSTAVLCAAAVCRWERHIDCQQDVHSAEKLEEACSQCTSDMT